MNHDLTFPRYALAAAAVLAIGIGGCNSKPQFPKLSDVLGQPKTAASPEIWDEHTLGLPFVYGYDEGIAAAQREGRPAMIFLTTTWCKWCKRMSEACFQDPEIRSQLEQNFVLVLVDGDTEAAVKRRLKNTGYPHIVFVSPDQQILAAKNGYAEPAAFKQVIATALSSG